VKAQLLERLAPLAENPTPLRFVDVDQPLPAAGEVLLAITACGVCHTELDEIEGRLPPPRLPVIPGHQVVGLVQALGEGVSQHRLGDRVGVGWIHSSTGAPDENLAPEFRATGLHANGGYAQYMTVPEGYAYAIPELFDDAEAAPLLCAGAIGFRALKLCGIVDGDALGLMGFGGSGHLVLKLARGVYPNASIAVFARDADVCAFARRLGADWAGSPGERAPFTLRAVIDTTPAWQPVVQSLANLAPGGRLVINAIRKEDDDQSALLTLRYHEHLWLEREIKSVANITAADIVGFLAEAARLGIRPEVTTYALADANQALGELRQGRVQGAKVLIP
jgi:propanol-preferring alcohol dehydrogenase